MIRRITIPAALITCALAIATLGATPAVAAPSVSCSGHTSTTASSTAVTVTGTATCNGLTTMTLTTTIDNGGAVSTVTSLLPALPNIPLPIDVTTLAANVTGACSALVNAATGATVSTSCSGGAGT